MNQPLQQISFSLTGNQKHPVNISNCLPRQRNIRLYPGWWSTMLLLSLNVKSTTVLPFYSFYEPCATSISLKPESWDLQQGKCHRL